VVFAQQSRRFETWPQQYRSDAQPDPRRPQRPRTVRGLHRSQL